VNVVKVNDEAKRSAESRIEGIIAVRNPKSKIRHQTTLEPDGTAAGCNPE